MRSEEKVSYIPSESKRWEISSDPFSRERLKTLVTVVKKLRQIHPFVAGAVLFGSLSKGKKLDAVSASGSDIDLAIFVDTDNLRGDYAQLAASNNKRFNEVVEVDQDMHKDSDLRTEAQKDLLRVGLYITYLAEDLYLENAPSLWNLPPKIGFNDRPISLKGRNSIFWTFNRIFKHHNLELITEKLESSDLDFDPLTYSSIALPWCLDIGGGLRKYRRAYLERLRKLPKEERDLRWRVTVGMVKFYERKGIIPEGIREQYPATFDEALKYYGVVKPK